MVGLTIAAVLSIHAWILTTTTCHGALPSVGKLQGIWKGQRNSTGYMVGSTDGSWQVGCNFDVVDRFRRGNVTVFNTDTSSGIVDVVLEVGGYDVDLTWHFKPRIQVVKGEYSFVGDVHRWVRSYNATITDYVDRTVQFETSDPVIGEGANEGCQVWDVFIPTNASKQPPKLQSYEVFEVTVYSDGSLIFDTPCPTGPVEGTSQQFCDDTRFSKTERDAMAKRRADRKARLARMKKNGVVNNGYLGYCLDPDVLNAEDLTDETYIQAQLKVGASELNRCLDYLANGLSPLFQNNPDPVQGNARTCFDTIISSSTFQRPRDYVLCVQEMRDFFESQVGDNETSRANFCQMFPTCYVCEFCTVYRAGGDACNACGGDQAPPYVSGGLTWNGYDPYATTAPTTPITQTTLTAATIPTAQQSVVTPPAVISVPPPGAVFMTPASRLPPPQETFSGRRRKLQQEDSYTIRIAAITEVTCVEGPCLFVTSSQT